MGQLDSSVVLVALPAMAQSFAVRAVDLSPGVTVYVLAQAVLLPISNWVAERLGARRVFVLALVFFCVASIGCGVSHSFGQFIAARVLQGAAAALMIPVARIILLQSTRKQDLISATAISTVPMLVAPTLGPAIGGLLTTYASWPWIFFLNIPFGVLAVISARRFLPDLPGQPGRGFDAVGFALTAASIVGLLSGLNYLSQATVRWTPAIVLTVGGLVVGVAAMRHLWRHPAPIVSLHSTRVRTYSITALGGGALVRLPMRAASFVLPLLFQFELGFSAFQAGLMLLALNGGDLVLKAVTTRTLRRFGFRTVLLTSGLAMMVLTGACAGFSVSTPVWLMVLVLTACGMARSLLFTGMSTLSFADVPPGELGNASVLWNVMQQVTNALGVSIAAITLNFVAAALGQPAGYIGRYNCLAALLVATAIGAFALLEFRKLPLDAGAAISGHSLDSCRDNCR